MFVGRCWHVFGRVGGCGRVMSGSGYEVVNLLMGRESFELWVYLGIGDVATVWFRRRKVMVGLPRFLNFEL